LGGSPQYGAAQGGAGGLNHIVTDGLKPLGNRLAPGKRNQTGEDHLTAWFTLDRETDHTQGSHLAHEGCPFVSNGLGQFWSG
jgi:hypothetical protein